MDGRSSLVPTARGSGWRAVRGAWRSRGPTRRRRGDRERSGWTHRARGRDVRRAPECRHLLLRAWWPSRGRAGGEPGSGRVATGALEHGRPRGARVHGARARGDGAGRMDAPRLQRHRASLARAAAPGRGAPGARRRGGALDDRRSRTPIAVALPLLLEAVERLPAFTRLTNTLPVPGERRRIAGLAGSSDAAAVAALSRHATSRFLVVVTDALPDAERWLADLRSLLEEDIVALYPPREGFGEAEPHMEVAGERVETLERTMRGDVRLLVTTARALLERTRMPRALRELRVELKRGESRRLSELVEHFES